MSVPQMNYKKGNLPLHLEAAAKYARIFRIASREQHTPPHCDQMTAYSPLR